MFNSIRLVTEKMHYHIHIPKLFEFAIYIACDDIFRLGTRRKKPIPYVLYLKSQVAFGEKYSGSVTVKKLYDMMRLGNDPAFSSIDAPLNVLVCLVHHADLSSTSLSPYVTDMVSYSHNDIDSVVACLLRFAARCVIAGKFDVLSLCMSDALKQRPCKAIRDILMQYGGTLDPNHYGYLDSAIGCGMNEVVENVLEHSSASQGFDWMLYSLQSGDINTVKLIASKGCNIRQDSVINAVDFNITYCEQLVTLGVVKHNKHYKLTNIRSIAVLQWLIDHGMLDIQHAAYTVANKALSHGGVYVDVLHYLIEHAHVPVPKDILLRLDYDHISDIGVLDYLLPFADINAVGHVRSVYDRSTINAPEYLRYWMDNGLKLKNNDVGDVLRHCVTHNCFVLLDILIDELNIDVKLWLKNNDDGMLIFYACERSHIDIAEALLELGANPNGMLEGETSTLHLAIQENDVDFISLLLDHGVDANIKGYHDETPLYDACKSGNYEIVEMLLDDDDVNIDDVNADRETALHAAARDGDYDMVELLLEHDANVQMLNDDRLSPYDVTKNRGIRRLLLDHGYVAKKREGEPVKDDDDDDESEDDSSSNDDDDDA